MANEKICPICGGIEVFERLVVKDHSVSGEIFQLFTCRTCEALYTLNPPAPDQIGVYYQSDAYISHTDSNKGLFNKVYQRVRKFALTNKRKLIEHHDAGKAQGKILDYGCGTGAFLQEMKLAGWDVTGLEPDESARNRASSLINQTIYEPTLLESMPSGSYQVITLWHVLEHVHDLHETVARLADLMADNGLMIIAVPNHLSYDAQHYGQYWAAYDVPRHLYHFNPQSLKHLLSSYGLEINRILPMWFDSFYVSLLSEKYRSGKMRIISAIWQGISSNVKALIRPGTCSSQIYLIKKKISLQ
jgi:2-polyprenyl-3-methyl-5-hydroxy-6-metoxy-1,4-benzoquinol methylase